MTENFDLKLELPLWDIKSIYKNYDDPEYINDKKVFSETVELFKKKRLKHLPLILPGLKTCSILLIKLKKYLKT